MRTVTPAAIFFVGMSLHAGQALGQQPLNSPAIRPQTAETVWDAAFWKDRDGRDHKFGYVSTTFESVDSPDGATTRAKREYRLNVRQGRSTLPQAYTLTTEEAGDRLLKLEYRDGQLLRRLEALPGGGYTVESVLGGAVSRRAIPKNYHPIGLAAEVKVLTSLREVGRKFDYQYFDPTLNLVVDVKGEAKQLQKLDRGGRQDERESLRIVSRGEKIQGFLPPEGTLWIDPKSGEVQGSLMEIPGIGYVTLVRTTKEFATSRDDVLPDVQQNTNIHLAAKVPGLHERSEATYRITLQQPVAPGELLAKSDLQVVTPSQDDRRFELKVLARRTPAAATPVAAEEEFIAPNDYIASDDPQIRALAKRAAGSATSDWGKAQQMELWLAQHFRFADGKSLQTAKEIAADPTGLCGNCKQTGILLAALCRAEGIPSRTALGLIYAEVRGEPVFAFHMWTEVFIDGQWIGLDATRGQGSVGPGHLKITDASWAGERGMTPLLPVMNFISKQPKIEFVK